MIDWILACPWPNRRRPYVALHISPWGWRCGPKHRRIYTIGVMWGRQFMPGPNRTDQMKWWNVEIPWPRNG